MVNPFRRWFGGPHDGKGWMAAADWARANGFRFARSRDVRGFAIEPQKEGKGWRLEWGPSQRHYFSGPELRLRAEVGPIGDLQMLVITRELMALLEQQVFEESTDSTQTRVDDDLPEEMRWLVLHPKVPRAELGTLREHFGALSNVPGAARSWIEGALGKQLGAALEWLPEKQALVLVVQRGRLSLRFELPEPSLPVMRGALSLFGAALTAARRVGTEMAEGRFGRDSHGTSGAASTKPPPDAPAP